MLHYLGLLIIVMMFSIATHAQGCSDAGFCTLHSVKGNTLHNNGIKEPNQIAIGFGFGKGEDAISYYTPYVQYSRSFKKTTVTTKVNYNISDGRLATTGGLGDVFVSVNHDFDVNKAVRKSLIGGIKVNLGQSDIIEKGIHLPMPYQPSLGTVDLIGGLNVGYKSFGAGAAIQQPLSSRNNNNFLPSDYPSHPGINEYLPNRKFERKGDALLRLSYHRKLGERFSVRPGLLGIYHLGDDTYLNNTGSRVKIYGSEGLTLNGTLFLNWSISSSREWELALGTPFVVRPSRPDGLTRSFVATLEYKVSF